MFSKRTAPLRIAQIPRLGGGFCAAVVVLVVRRLRERVPEAVAPVGEAGYKVVPPRLGV